jgi:hypothetical protein
MANVLYDKTARYPPAGSLREALFLHVWLRRQAIEIDRTKLMAQGLANKDNVEFVVKAFDSYVSDMLPYMKDHKQKTDKEMITALKKEVALGRVEFKVLDDPKNNLLKNRAIQMSAPDEYRAKLAAGVAKRRGLKR